MVHIPARHPAGDLWSCKSAILPICHMLFPAGVYSTTPWGRSRFHCANAPNQQEFTVPVHTISHRVARCLERKGILERDEENSYLKLEEGDEDPVRQVLGSSVSYRIAIGPQQGCKVFRLPSLSLPSWLPWHRNQE